MLRIAYKQELSISVKLNLRLFGTIFPKAVGGLKKKDPAGEQASFTPYKHESYAHVQQEAFDPS